MSMGSDWNKHCAVWEMATVRMVITATKCHTHTATIKLRYVSVRVQACSKGVGVGGQANGYLFQTPGAASADELSCLSRLGSR